MLIKLFFVFGSIGQTWRVCERMRYFTTRQETIFLLDRTKNRQKDKKYKRKEKDRERKGDKNKEKQNEEDKNNERKK
jgi:hypothetical protein